MELWIHGPSSVLGQGYATEACRALIDFALRVLGVSRLSGNVHADNIGSVRVLEKVGAPLVRRSVETSAKNGEQYQRVEYEIEKDPVTG